MDQYAVRFSGNDISQVSGVDLYNHDFNKLPQREIKINKIARRDLSIITSAEYSQKEITVNMDVCSGSRADTEATLTLLKSLLQPQNAALVASQGGVDVEYSEATMQELSIEWLGATAIVTIIFIASDPIGKQSELETLVTLSAMTVASTSENITVGGSAMAYPLITVTVTAVTGGTGGSIIVTNGRTLQGITVTGDWTAGDILEINSQLLTVTVNGSIVDFDGMFPQFPAGTQQITYLDTFTTRTVTLNAVYQPRFV